MLARAWSRCAVGSLDGFPTHLPVAIPISLGDHLLRLRVRNRFTVLQHGADELLFADLAAAVLILRTYGGVAVAGGNVGMWDHGVRVGAL